MSTYQCRLINRILLVLFALLMVIQLFGGLPSHSTRAAAQFGSGLSLCPTAVPPVLLKLPIVIIECTQAALQGALDQGGEITFACGEGAVTIPLTSQLILNPTTDTILDGRGLVTLDGQNQTRILYKGWHDPALGEVRIVLQNIRLVNGRAPSGGSTGDHSGGALAAGHPGTRIHLINVEFENNHTTAQDLPDNQGGAVFVHNAYETVISGSVFRGNSAGNGGAFGGIATGLRVVNTLFEQNQAVDTLPDDIVRGYGGAVHLDGVSNDYNPSTSNQVSFCGDVFRENIAIRGGGATSVVISDNLGTQAVYRNVTFTGNQALGLPAPLGEEDRFGQGGAIYHIEDDHAGGSAEINLEIRDSTFSNNQALRQGGAVWLYFLGQGQVINATFSGNSTLAAFNKVGQGGAMAVTLGNLYLLNNVFANNHAAYQGGALHGGGIENPRLTVTLANSIFYNNTLNIGQTLPSETEWQGFHTNRPLTDGGNNIQYPRYKPTYDNDVNNWITPAPLFVDPLLGVLGDYGGPTQTLPLLAGSPAIDAANPLTCPALDQRGYTRQGVCDIGVFEWGGIPFAPESGAFLPLVTR
jgi:hypothetical protein